MIQTQMHLVVKMKNTNNASDHATVDEVQDVVQSTSLKALCITFHQDVFIRADF